MASFLVIRFSLLVFLPLYICNLALAQNNGRIDVDRSLTAGEERSNPWVSPNGDFGFGFKQLHQDEDQFLLAIWYAKIPEETVVWHAHVSRPVPRGSRLQLDSQFGLVLRDPRAQKLWNTDWIQPDIAYGFLEDTGNFVLVANDNTTWLWQSFKRPTDTLLPSQEIEIGGGLISRRTETNFSQGRFYLRMLENGDLVLNTKSVPSNLDFDDEYYNSFTSDDPANPSNSGSKVVFDERGYMYILRKNGTREDVMPRSRSIPPISDYYHRVTLAFDGVLTQYSRPRTSSGGEKWSSVSSQPDNICISINGNKGSGACGYNSFCTLNDAGRPFCQCPEGYSLLDPKDSYGSCKPDFAQSCDGSVQGPAGDLYEFMMLKNTDWPYSDFEQLNPSTEDECINACLYDCFCAVAIYRSNSCWKKKLPLSNGRSDITINVTAFIKHPKGGTPQLDPKSPSAKAKNNDRQTLGLVGSVLLGTSVSINILLIAAGCLGFFLIYQKKIGKIFLRDNSLEINLRCFTFGELEVATNGFKEELGRGAFGVVYKGEMSLDSRTIVAVKKLDRVAQDTEKEFRTEVNVIGQTHHKNLVRLIGFCDERQNRLLVYEYMSNRTLANFLFGDLRPSWSQRTKIAQGVARGLLYLHEECSSQIIHCDIKPQNILLDDYYNARISDFGLAKLLMINQSRTNPGIRGTKGYVAPEWFRYTPISVKVDVYSFGVLLLEIISCRKSFDLENGGEEKAILTDWAWDCFREGRLDGLVGDDMEALNDCKNLERFVKVGIWCIQEDPSSRPTMRKVSQMLEGVVEVTKPPCPFPSFSTTS